MEFDLVPFVGALPVRFGMHRSEVHRLLGPPERSYPIWDSSGTSDFWNESRVNVGYDNGGTVQQVGMSPGGCTLSLNGALLWSLGEQPDPNPTLLRLDPSPVEYVGILFYPALGIGTTGYHDGDEEQLALTVAAAEACAAFLERGRPPDLSRYRAH